MADLADLEHEFKTANFFDNSAFSDVTIKYDGKEVKAHKMILCTRSKYFERMLGQGSQFKVSISSSLHATTY